MVPAGNNQALIASFMVRDPSILIVPKAAHVARGVERLWPDNSHKIISLSAAS